MPAGKIVKIGVWEDSKFIGCVLFSRGANKSIASPFGLKQTDVCELTRVALAEHKTPVSRILRISISFLKKYCPDLKLIVSYADIDRGHLGVVYQANNWVYIGHVNKNMITGYVVKGRYMHNKSIHSLGVRQSIKDVQRWLDPKATVYRTKGKHKYLYPLNDEIRAKIGGLRQEYPQRASVV